MAKFAVILPAAGAAAGFTTRTTRSRFAPLANKAVWLHSAERFVNRDDVKQMIVVISPDDREYFQFKFAANTTILGIDVVEGGAERADSVAKALAHVEARHRLRVHSRRGPALPGRRVDRHDLRRRREDRRRHLCHAGRRHAQARGQRTARSKRPSRATGCGRPRRRRSSAASCCWKPTPSGATSRRPTTPNWSSASANA